MSNVKNYIEQGGEKTVIDGELAIGATGKITKAGTQAAHIADATDAVTPAAFNAVLKALEDVGILASE